MISYKPLRDYLKRNKLSPNRLYADGVITTNIATAINKDLKMSMDNVEKICLHLNIPIEQMLVVLPSEDSEPTER